VLEGTVVPIPIFPFGSMTNLLVDEVKSYMSSVPDEIEPTLKSNLFPPVNVLAKDIVEVFTAETWRVDDG
jgi:hypothetical protein